MCEVILFLLCDSGLPTSSSHLSLLPVRITPANTMVAGEEGGGVPPALDVRQPLVALATSPEGLISSVRTFDISVPFSGADLEGEPSCGGST